VRNYFYFTYVGGGEDLLFTMRADSYWCVFTGVKEFIKLLTRSVWHPPAAVTPPLLEALLRCYLNWWSLWSRMKPF